jgi:predicted ester cyclase
MSTEKNKVIVRRVLEEFWHNGDEGVLDELFATDYVNHELSNPEVRGLEEYKQWALGARAMWNTGLSDWRITAEDLVAEGDKVLKRWVIRGTHSGELLGMPATGKPIEMRGMSLYRFSGGKVREIYWNYDVFNLAQQIGAVPAAAAAG